MPTSNWIENVTLIPEGQDYKIDTSGRVVIPTYIRNKFDVDIADSMDFYTAFADNKWFICMTPSPNRPSLKRKLEAAAAEAESAENNE